MRRISPAASCEAANELSAIGVPDGSSVFATEEHLLSDSGSEVIILRVWGSSGTTRLFVNEDGKLDSLENFPGSLTGMP